jgi:hypothetical protein
MTGGFFVAHGIRSAPTAHSMRGQVNTPAANCCDATFDINPLTLCSATKYLGDSPSRRAFSRRYPAPDGAGRHLQDSSGHVPDWFYHRPVGR